MVNGKQTSRVDSLGQGKKKHHLKNAPVKIDAFHLKRERPRDMISSNLMRVSVSGWRPMP